MPGEDTLRITPGWAMMEGRPVRVKVVLEDEDGTELYYFFPLGDRTVRPGQVAGFTVDFTDGLSVSES